jgi:site-specific DNA-methyltransferase (adenine-specific)
MTIGDITVLHGDCMDVLPTLADGSVNAIVTDPPYGTGQWKRTESGAGRDQRAGHLTEAWDVWDPRWLVEAVRVSRGPIAFFMPITRIEDALAFARHHSLTWRLLFWGKSDPRPRFSGQPAFGFEPVMAFRTPLRGEKDWMEASSPRKNRDRDGTGHPHQKPLIIIRWLCEMVSARGETILDPFAGSGTTGVACLKSGRRCILIEKDIRYIPVIERRLKAAETPLFQGLGVE